MKLSDFTLRQVAIGIPLLGLLNWAVFQFAILPSMSANERKQLYQLGFPWAGVEVGAALAIFGIGGLKNMKDDAESAALDDDSPSA